MRYHVPDAHLVPKWVSTRRMPDASRPFRRLLARRCIHRLRMMYRGPLTVYQWAVPVERYPLYRRRCQGIIWTRETIREFWEEVCLYQQFFPAPTIPEVNLQTVVSLEPKLQDTPVYAIRQVSVITDPKFWQCVHASISTCPRITLPKEWEILMDDYMVSFGCTHYLGYSSPFHRERYGARMLYMIPVDMLLLAAYCSRLPTIPSSHPKVTFVRQEIVSIGDEGGPTAPMGFSMMRLPTLYITVPDPSTFHIMLQYFASRNKWQMIFNLVGWAPGFHGRLVHSQQINVIVEKFKMLFEDGWTSCIASRCHPWQIAEHMNACKGLWMNMVALGVSDESIWQTLRIAWDVLWMARQKQMEATTLEIHNTETPRDIFPSYASQAGRIFSVPLTDSFKTF